MKEGILARRYAKALFEIALEHEQLDKVWRELTEFVTTLEENVDLAHFIASPENSRVEKRNAVEKVFQDRFSAIFVNFLLLLIEKGRSNLYAEIGKAFNDLYDRHRRKLHALITSAVPLAEQEKKDLESELSERLKMNLELENRVDPAILGGLVLNIEGKILDGSVKRQLEKLREIVSSQLN